MRRVLQILFITMVMLAGSSAVMAQDKSTYTVKKGDTLFSISKQLEVTIAELKQWNDIQGNDLSIGQELVYYSPDATGENNPQRPSQPLIDTSQRAANTYYTVKSGDNLYTIARLHNMTLEQLKELNNLTSDQIRVGQRLAVKKLSVAPSVADNARASTPQGAFSLYKVERGEGLNSILRKFNISRPEFEALNPDLDVSSLDRGQKVTVLLPPNRNYENPYLQKANLQDLGNVAVSEYATSESGKTTTNGELYDPEGLSAAHSNIALGSIIFIENKSTGKGIYVKVNDRITGSGLKLSNKAYRILGLNESGQPTVTIFTGS